MNVYLLQIPYYNGTGNGTHVTVEVNESDANRLVSLGTHTMTEGDHKYRIIYPIVAPSMRLHPQDAAAAP